MEKAVEKNYSVLYNIEKTQDNYKLSYLKICGE